MSEFFEFFQRKDAGGDFVKLQDGQSARLRLIAKPVQGYEVFVEGRPHRWRPNETRPAGLTIPDGESVRQFAAFVVCEYDKEKPIGRVKIWSINQKSIIADMQALFVDAHWTEFELRLSRFGEGLRTKYTLNGVQRDIEPELLAFASESDKYIDLTKIYDGESPFLEEPPHLVPKKTTNPDGLPF